MMAASGQDSLQSPSAERTLLSLPGRASPSPEEGDSRSSGEIENNSIVSNGHGAVGVAGLEANVGNMAASFHANAVQERIVAAEELFIGDDHESKTSSRRCSESVAAAATAGGDAPSATSTASHSPGGGDGGGGDLHASPTGVDTPVASTRVQQGGDDKDSSSTGSPTSTSTRNRRQQLYESYRQTQLKLKTIRDETATLGCTFSPQLLSKQKTRKSKEGVNADHLYQDFHKQQEKRERMAAEEEKKLSFRPILPTASSRLAAKMAVTPPVVAHKRAEDKSKATAEAMYKECTFTPDTVITRARTDKILAAKGKQAPVADRLYAVTEKKVAMLKIRKEAQADQELAECTFRPDTSSTSKRSSSGSGRGESESVHQQLFNLHGKMLMSKQAKREELIAKERIECTFAPALVAKSPSGKKSPVTAAADGDQQAAGGGNGDGCKKTEPVYERLYNRRGQNQAREAFVDLECTFQPNTQATKFFPSKTRALSEESRVEEMYNNGKERQRARSQSPRNYTATFRAQAESEEMKQCTFKPDVSWTRNSRFKKEPRGQAVFEALFAKSHGQDQEKERIRKEDMKACTFSPELASQQTRVGRSLSPQRLRPVYEELYEVASMQRVARSLSAEALQSQQCPFQPQLVTRKNVTKVKVPAGKRQGRAAPGPRAAIVATAGEQGEMGLEQLPTELSDEVWAFESGDEGDLAPPSVFSSSAAAPAAATAGSMTQVLPTEAGGPAADLLSGEDMAAVFPPVPPTV